MKIPNQIHCWLLLFCVALLGVACQRSEEDVELPPVTVELDAPLTYGTADLDVFHTIPLGIGSIEAETKIPIRFPVKQGDRFVEGMVFHAQQETEALIDLAAEGMVERVSSEGTVPATYQITGEFTQCAFKLDVVEIIHWSQVETWTIPALGEFAVDMGADEDWTYPGQVLTAEEHEILIKDPALIGEFRLVLSNVALPPDLRLICGFSQE